MSKLSSIAYIYIHNLITWTTIGQMIYTQKKANKRIKKYEEKRKAMTVVVVFFSLPLEKKSIVNCIFYRLKIKN
jgi:hypothetical protein